MGTAFAKETLQTFRNAGVDEFYVMTVLEFVQTYPVIIAIPGEPKLSSEILRMLEEQHIFKAGFETDTTFFVMSNEFPPAPALGRTFLRPFVALKSPLRPDIHAAMRLQSKSPIRIIFTPTAGLKAMAQMFLPMAMAQSPTPVDTNAVMSFIKDMESVSIGIDPAALRINFAVQLPSEEIAQKAGKLLATTYEKSLDESPDPAFAKAIKPLVIEFIPKPKKNRLILVINEALIDKYETALTGALLPAVVAARAAAQRVVCANNVKQLVLAMHNYHEVHKAFPPLYTVNSEGKPLHSWRVLILPYIETGLYEQIRLDEPWDSEHNSQFHKQVINIYQCSDNKNSKPGADCCYAVIAGEAFIPAKGAGEIIGNSIANITDGISNTIGIVEVKEPFCWMDPTKDVSLEELQKGINTQEGRVGSSHPGIINVGMLDGSARVISNQVPQETLKALGTCAGGENVTLDNMPK
jgi:hypothetical protein